MRLRGLKSDWHHESDSEIRRVSKVKTISDFMDKFEFGVWVISLVVEILLHATAGDEIL